MPTSSVPDSQGTTFSFAGLTSGITSVKVKNSRSTVDASTLSLASGTQRALQAAPLTDGGTVTVEFIGSTAPAVGTNGAISCSIGGVTGNAICEEVEITAAVGELLKGTATFRLTGASS